MPEQREPMTDKQVIQNIMAVKDEVHASVMVGDHLSDEEFVKYAMDEVSVEERDKIDRHLCTCWECTVEVERLSSAYGKLKKRNTGN